MSGALFAYGKGACMGRRGDTVRRRIGARAYGHIIAESGLTRIEPIIPWEEPDADPRAAIDPEDLPPEHRGHVLAFMAYEDLQQLVLLSKGWRFKRVAPLLKLNPDLYERAMRGEFDTIEAVTAAIATEQRRRYCGAA